MSKYSFIEPPKPTWKCQLVEGTYWHVVIPPNRFHRFMQTLCFGIVWTKL